MALKGTIRDFGVAEIFQLVSQQGKTGVLLFRSDIDSVRVFFREGAVVNAESATKNPERMLGTLLVRAEVITQVQLDQALIDQQRTLQRLAQVLLDLTYITPAVLKEFTTLQLTETIYSLFEWKDGTYQFDAEDVSPSPDGVEPIRADSLVLDALRHVDEWPAIRERIPSYLWLVERTRDLPEELPMSDSFPEWDLEAPEPEADRLDLGAQERRIFELIHRGQTVQKLIDLSRMGEFETCQALSVLMQAGYVRVIKPPPNVAMSGAGGIDPLSGAPRWVRIAGRIAVSGATVILTAFLLAATSRNLSGRGEQDLTYRRDPVATRLASTQIKVLRRAIEVYRFQTGSYPLSLDDLVEGGFVEARDVHFPFTQSYFYRVTEGGDVLLLPPVR